MMSSIRVQLTTIFLSFIVLLIINMAATYSVLQRQADDGLIVNLAGRQRMLTQKMTKESMQLANASYENNTDQINKYRDQLNDTIKVFDMTLFALKDGGSAPLDLQLRKMRTCPPAATKQIQDQLQKVVDLWQPFQKHVDGVMSSRGKSREDIDVIASTNVPLLKEMNKAVFMMQADAETKVSLLYIVQGITMGLGFLLVLTGFSVVSSQISTPILNLASAAQAMSTGNLTVEFKRKGAQEVKQLADSFDRMRASIIASLDGSFRGGGADLDDDI